ncbi:MAG: DUF2190 family protein [Roseovarius sp.]
MATNFVQRGEQLTLTAGATIASGDVVEIGSILGVAMGDAVSGGKVDVAVSGVWSLPKVSADDVSEGDPIYWDSGAGLVTVTSTDNTRLGTAVEAAGNGVGTVAVRLVSI